MTAQAVLEEQPLSPERVKKAKKATMVAVFGTFIEYYDFSVYGYVAATGDSTFNTAGEATVSTLTITGTAS